MLKTGTRTADMTAGPPLKTIMRFALPLLIGNLFNQLYNVVDTAIVGRFISADALAAVGSTGNVNSFLFMLIGGLCVGCGVIVAQYWGAERYKELARLLGTFALMILVVSVAVAVVGLLAAPFILRLLQVPPALLADAVSYMRITVGLVAGVACYNGAAAVLRSMGDSRTPLLAMVLSSATNVVLDLLLIIRFGMGVRGAAIATVAAQFLSAAVCLIALARRRAPMDFSNIRLRFCGADARLLLKFGVPSALQSAMISLGGMSVQGLVNTFGSATMAAYTAVQRIDALTIQVVVSVSNALAVFTGQNIGVKNVARVRAGLRQTLAALSGICLALAVLVFFFRRGLLSLFLDPVTGAQSITLGGEYLTVIGFAYVIAAVMNTHLNVIRGAGDVNVSVVAGLFELGARVVFAYVLSHFIGVWGIWLATPLSWGCGCIIPVVRYYSNEWTKKAL